MTDPSSVHANNVRQVLARKRVLIVDDEDDARDLLRHVLESCNIEVLDASNAGDALDTLDSSRVDAIVSDIGMPGRDGYSLIRAVRSSPGHASVPSIALTAFNRREDQTRALHEGFDRHVAKPFDVAFLLDTLATLVTRVRPEPPKSNTSGR